MSEAAENEKLRSMRYADAMERLQVILEEIDDSAIGIDDLAERVKEASDLLKLCREILTKTEADVEEALKGLEDSNEE
jgi:exodeoxyribonuclease VII small subunit